MAIYKSDKSGIKSTFDFIKLIETDGMVTMHRVSDQNALVIGFSDLDIIWNLGIGIWDLVSYPDDDTSTVSHKFCP